MLSTRGEAEAVAARLRSGADFAALAQEVSRDAKTRDLGGHLFVSRSDLVWLPKLVRLRAILRNRIARRYLTAPRRSEVSLECRTEVVARE